MKDINRVLSKQKEFSLHTISKSYKRYVINEYTEQNKKKDRKRFSTSNYITNTMFYYL